MTRKQKRPIALSAALAMVLSTALDFSGGALDNIGFGLTAHAEDDGYVNGFCTEYELKGACTNLNHTNANGQQECNGYQRAADENNDGVYEIGNAGQLYWFADLVINKCLLTQSAVLTDDITVNENVLTADGKLNPNLANPRLWTPIGYVGDRYSGTFDGQGHTISGLITDTPDNDYVGLFKSIDEKAHIKNVGVEDNYFSGRYYVGGICGGSSGTIENCYNAGTIKSSSVSTAFLGGICGSNESGSVIGCFNIGNVIGINCYIGGICGENGCYGETTDALIKNCYNAGRVDAPDNYNGGICGQCFQGKMENCYNKGTLNSSYPYQLSGGWDTVSSEFTNCYYLQNDSYYGDNGTAKTSDEFSSGDVCNLVGYHSYLKNECSLCGVAEYVTDITVTPNKLPLFLNGSEYLKANVLPSNAIDTSFEWISSDPNVATVDADGKVTAISIGTATIKACAKDGSGVYGECTVTVAEKSYQISIDDSILYGNVVSSHTFAKAGEVVTLKVTPAPCYKLKEGSLTVTTASSNTSIAVSNNAKFTMPNDNVTIHAVFEQSHNLDNKSYNDPTCLTDGNVEYYECSYCGKTFSDIEGQTEIENTTIPALGHSFTKYVSDNNATCTENGTETAKCDRCEEIDTREKADSALGHSFTEYVSDNNATCTENGTETAKCDHCDKTDTRVIADSALGHSFTKYVSDNNATCTENGTETAKCDRCDKTDTRVIADSALGHDHSGDWQNNDSDHWKVCARKDCTEILDKSAHKYDSGVITTQPTEEKEGVKTYTCETCKHTKTEPIAKLEAKIALPKATATAGVNSVSLKWNAVDGAKSYRAFYRVNGTKAWTPKNTTGTSVTITDLTGGTKYDFLVLAYDGTNWSKYTDSDIITATPKTAVVTPAKPVFTATPGVNSISLKWNAVSGAASYRVYYRLNGTTPWKYRNTTATAVTLTELTGGKKYDIAVRAYSGSAWSTFTTRDIVNATPLAAGNKPVFSSVTPGVNRAILRWNAVDGAKSYRVYYRVSGTTKWSYKNTTLTAMNLTGLTGGKTYEFVVRAYNGSTWTAYSSADIAKATIKS